MRDKPSSLNGIVLLVIVCLVIGITVLFAESPLTQTQTTISDFSWHDSDGKKGSLYQFKDQPVIIHFWASWCSPCRKELPELIKKAAVTPHTVFLLISVDQNKQDMLNFLKPYKALLSDNIVIINDQDDSITKGHFNIDQFPETLILKKDKTVAQHIYGMTEWGEH